MKKVAVIGSNSFSGGDFIDLLLSETDYQVTGISRSAEKPEMFLPYRKNPQRKRFRFHQLDLNEDMTEIQALLDNEKPSYIVNFAAQSEVGPSWDNPDQWFRTNAVAIAALGDYLRRQDWLQRYIHISSPEVYGTCEGTVTEDAPLDPSTPYAASKAAGDLMLFTLVKNFDFPMVMIRSTNVYGAGQQLFKIIPRTAIYLKSGRKIQLHGGGASIKSYIHIRDISRGELAAMQKGTNGFIYHLSPDSGIAVRDVVRKICELMGKSFAENTEVVAERLGQDKAYVIDSTRARNQFGWRPQISLDEGLCGVSDWIEKYWAEIENQSWDYIHKK